MTKKKNKTQREEIWKWMRVTLGQKKPVTVYRDNNRNDKYEFDESTADGDAGVKFAGGSNPTLTTDANHVDILSFYWDADNEIAYGVATLDFQF